MKSAASCVHVPNRMKSCGVSALLENFRIVIVGPESASGGMMALTREPSDRRASTYGCYSSQRLPSGAIMRSMTAMTLSSSENWQSESSSFPPRST